MVGFRVTVLDDREEFAQAARFPFAAETAVITPSTGWLTGRDIGENTSIVIVTRGHAHDKNALAEALRTPAGYIGMIGSLPKRDSVYGRLLAEGFAPGRSRPGQKPHRPGNRRRNPGRDRG